MTQKIQNAYDYISQKKLPLTGELIKQIQADRDIIIPKLTEDNEDDILDDTKCSNFLTKATRELNLMYIEKADEIYKIDNPNELSAYTPERLLETGYITFNPTDYQQYEDEDYGIVYKYNKDTHRFDYEMSY